MKIIIDLLRKFKVIISSLCIIILLICLLFYNSKNNNIDSTYILTRLEESSELTTIKLNYTGMSEFVDSGIFIINRADFTMVYEATARVGVDVKEIKIDIDNFKNIVWVSIPDAKVLDVKVDSSKIKYFDEKFALFNLDSKSDVNKGIVLAEQEAREELDDMGILKMADKQAETLIKGLIQDIIPKDYVIKIKE